MNYYCDPEFDTTARCPACGSDIGSACSGSDSGPVMLKQHGKASIAGMFRGYAQLAAVALPLVLFVTIVMFASAFLDTRAGFADASIKASELNIWLNHTLLSIDGSQTQDLEMQSRIDDNKAELDVRSPAGKIEHLRPFSSLRELQQFLKIDETSELQYSSDFDCDDFAFTLSQNAMNLGYQVFPFAEGAHLKNVAHVSLGTKSTAVYLIEPQTDEISLWGRVD